MTKTTNKLPRTKLTYCKADPDNRTYRPHIEVTISGKDEAEMSDADWDALNDLAGFIISELGCKCEAIADCGACYVTPGPYYDGDEHYVTEWKREVRETYAAWKESRRTEQAVAADAVATAHAEAAPERTLTAESAEAAARYESLVADAEKELEAAEDEYMEAETENVDAHDHPDCFDVELSDQRLADATRRLEEAREDLERAREDRDDYLANWARYEEGAPCEEEAPAVTPDVPAATAALSDERARDLAALHEDFGWSYYALARFYRITMGEAELICLRAKAGVAPGSGPDGGLAAAKAYAKAKYDEGLAEMNRLEVEYHGGALSFEEWNRKSDDEMARMDAYTDVYCYCTRAMMGRG